MKRVIHFDYSNSYFSSQGIGVHGEVAYSGFQTIHDPGSSEMRALDEEIGTREDRKT